MPAPVRCTVHRDVEAFVRTLWAGYMAQCADLCVELAERAPPDETGTAQR